MLYRGQWTRRLAASQRNITCISTLMKIVGRFLSRPESRRKDPFPACDGEAILWDGHAILWEFSRIPSRRTVHRSFRFHFIVVERIEGDIEKLRDEQRSA